MIQLEYYLVVKIFDKASLIEGGTDASEIVVQ